MHDLRNHSCLEHQPFVSITIIKYVSIFFKYMSDTVSCPGIALLACQPIHVSWRVITQAVITFRWLFENTWMWCSDMMSDLLVWPLKNTLGSSQGDESISMSIYPKTCHHVSVNYHTISPQADAFPVYIFFWFWVFFESVIICFQELLSLTDYFYCIQKTVITRCFSFSCAGVIISCDVRDFFEL